MIDKAFLSNPVFSSPQVPNLPMDPFGASGEILFANGHDGLPYIDNLPNDIRSMMTGNVRLNGTNIFLQLNSMFKEVEGGPWYIDSVGGIIFIHNKNFEDKPVKTYTYQQENGEVLSASFSLQTKYQGSTAGNPVSRAIKLNPEDPYNKAKQALIESAAESEKISDQIMKKENSALQAKMDPSLVIRKDNTSIKGVMDQVNISKNLKGVSVSSVNKKVNQEYQKQGYISINTARYRWGIGEGEIPSQETQQKLYDRATKKSSQNLISFSQLQNENPGDANKILKDVFLKDGYASAEFFEAKAYVQRLRADGMDRSQIVQSLVKKYPKFNRTITLTSNTGNNPYLKGRVSKVTKFFKGARNIGDVQQRLAKGELLEIGSVRKYSSRISRSMPIPGGGMTYNQDYGMWAVVTTTQGTNQVTVGLAGALVDYVDNSEEGSQFLQMKAQYEQLSAQIDRQNNRIAKLENALKKRKEMELTCTLKVVGKPSLTNYMSIELWNVGTKWSGVWYIRNCVHSIDSSGYITTMFLIRRS